MEQLFLTRKTFFVRLKFKKRTAERIVKYPSCPMPRSVCSRL